MTSLILPYHVRRDTLAYLKEQPLFLTKDMREVEVADVASLLKGYLSGCGEVEPEAEAVSFYAGNAVWAEILRRYAPDEPLPEPVLTLAKAYVQSASVIAQRVIYYLLLIITRESRHLGADHHLDLEQVYGPVFKNFNKGISNYASMQAKDYFLNNPPAMKLGAYADAILWTFNVPGGFSHGFGGEKWAEVANVFRQLVHGQFTPEMVTDVAWALSHNGGPVFDKGMCYEGYNKTMLYQILDVQRSGQIPEFIADAAVNHHVSTATFDLMVLARNQFPDAWGLTVDWHKVEQAGAVGDYSSMPKPMVNAASLPGNVYWVTPGVSVPVVERHIQKAA